MRYEITMNDASIRTMLIVNPNCTVEGEIAKWTDAADVASWVRID